MNILNKVYFDNTLLDYLITLGIIIGGIIIIFVIKTYVFHRVEKRAEESQNKFDDFLVNVLGKTLIPALYYGTFYISVQHLNPNPSIDKFLYISGVVIITFLGIRFILALVNYGLMHYWFEKVADDSKKKHIKSVMPVLKIAIYTIGAFFLLDNLGFKISTIIAGLGIGGVAVALAGQTILADLFSYFSILFDRPFEIGDFLILGDHMGVVEHIGVKTTRIRSLGGEQIILSNTDLTSSRVRNYKRMEARRVVFTVGVTYQTTLEQLKVIPDIIKNTISNIEGTTFDRCHFNQYGDFSLNIETVYYVATGDYNAYMDIQQQINLVLYEEFGKQGIEFAYPTQTLFLEKSAAST